MFCRNCGAENDTEAKFCKSCGQPLIESEQKTYQENWQSTQNTQNTNTGQDRSMYKYNYNSGDSDATVALIVGIISIVMCWSSVLAIGLGILAVVMAGKAKKQGSVSGNITGGQICGIVGICFGSITSLYYIFVLMLGFAGMLD